MNKFFLNSAVITAEGTYTYKYVMIQEAQQWAKSGNPISTIGYEQTAEALSELLEMKTPVDRRTIQMEAGDEAIVFRLALPPGSPRIDPKDKGQLRQILHDGSWELGLLKRVE